jgi:hypothetical protein
LPQSYLGDNIFLQISKTIVLERVCMFPKEVVGEKITLKLLDPKYFEEYHSMFSSAVRTALGLPAIATLGETSAFLAKKIEDLKGCKENGGKSENNAFKHGAFKYKVFYCIFDNADKKLVGSIEIREPGFKDGQLGAWLNENYWGLGRYQEALDLILKNYFEVSGYEFVNAYVKCENIRSLRAHQKYGFEMINELEVEGKKFYELVIGRDKVLGAQNF